jgi:hypothetical protein
MRPRSVPALLLAAGTLLAAPAPMTPLPLPAPQKVLVVYSEQSLDLTWDSVPGALGYNIYTSSDAGVPLAKRRRVNPALITSGTHFTYIWDVDGDQRVRNVKGVRHHLAIAAVDSLDGGARIGALSGDVDNDYFAGCDHMTSAAALRGVLVARQAVTPLPVPPLVLAADSLVRFMEGPGRQLARLIADSIDSREVGGCAPISTVVVLLLKHWRLPAYKVEGTFIREFHAFVVVNVDSVEYVLDFAADQFVPDVSPVLLPRDSCFITPSGRLGGSGQPAYQVARVLAADQTSLTEGKNSEVYRAIYTAVLESKNQPVSPVKKMKAKGKGPAKKG